VAEVCDTPAGALVLVMTHSHPLDLALVEALLSQRRSPFIGLIGSATKAARFHKQLQAKGLDTARLHCPIGLPGLAGKEPAVIAASTLAQLLLLSSGDANAHGHL
jgi:xanthine dehydrogenase accessory factor